MIGNKYSHSSRHVFRTTCINPKMNNHGKSLLHLCHNSGIQIMNDRGSDGCKMGKYTFCNSQGNASMIDYFISYATGASLISQFNVEIVRAESITLSITP